MLLGRYTNANAQGKLLYSGIYTSSNVMETYSMGNVTYGTGVSYLFSLKIYEQWMTSGSTNYPFLGKTTDNGRSARVYGNDRWYYLVYNDYSMYHVYKTSFCMTRTEYYKGNWVAVLQSGGNVNPDNNGNGNNYQTPQNNRRTCGVCGGNGEVIEWTTNYGGHAYLAYCQKCRKNMASNHYHIICKNCNGSGKVD